MLIFVILNLMDALTTFIHQRLGFEEMNPVLSFLLSTDHTKSEMLLTILLYKLICCSICGLFFIKAKYAKTLKLSNILMTFVVLWNLVFISYRFF